MLINHSVSVFPPDMAGDNISAKQVYWITHQNLDTAHTVHISESRSHYSKGKW